MLNFTGPLKVQPPFNFWSVVFSQMKFLQCSKVARRYISAYLKFRMRRLQAAWRIKTQNFRKATPISNGNFKQRIKLHFWAEVKAYDIFRRDICDQCLKWVCFQEIVCVEWKILGNHTCDSNVTWEGGGVSARARSSRWGWSATFSVGSCNFSWMFCNIEHRNHKFDSLGFFNQRTRFF